MSIHNTVKEAFRQRYGLEPEVMAEAPGRVEILGNHTDYNEGLVLSAAVDRSTVFAASRAPDDTCMVADGRSGSQRTFRLDALDDPAPGDWANYVKGLIVQLQRRNIEVPPFRGVLLSNVPLSAGMSSSAALEISAAYALGALAGVDLPWIEWARMGQACENEYVGANTGLLDQISSICGKKDHLVFSDFRTLDVVNTPLPEGVALVVANSMVRHTLTNEYNERRERCEEAVAVLQRSSEGITALRDVSPEELEACREAMDIIAYRRASHIVGENERVRVGAAALERGDVRAFGGLMTDSHESSRLNFENSCPALDTLIEIGESLPGFLGARLSGGGFGGITIHLVEEDQASRYAERLTAAYQSTTGKDPETMICHAADGARVL